MLTDGMTETQLAELMIASLAIAQALLIAIIVWPFSGRRQTNQSNLREGLDTT
jgi:hypothetical protein